MGYTDDDMRVWNPRLELGGLTDVEAKEATFLLWKGHCSVHQRFQPGPRRGVPGRAPRRHRDRPPRVLATSVCAVADQVGSTDYIIKAVEAAPAGSTIAVGHRDPPRATGWTTRRPTRPIVSLDPLICPCSTMFRIDAPHLAWVLENLVEGNVVNRITVDADTTEWAKVALDRMLAIT